MRQAIKDALQLFWLDFLSQVIVSWQVHAKTRSEKGVRNGTNMEPKRRPNGIPDNKCNGIPDNKCKTLGIPVVSQHVTLKMASNSVDGTTGGDLSENQTGKEQTRATEKTGVPRAVTAKPTDWRTI